MSYRRVPTRRATVALVFMLIACSDLAAQERPENRIGLSMGLTHLAHQDIIQTPFIHGGLSPLSFGITYEREGTWMHFAEGHYHVVTSRIGEPFEISHGDHGHDNLPHIFLFIDVSYGLGKPILARGNHTGTLGAAARLDIQGAFYNLGERENFGYFISPGLNVWYRSAVRVSERHSLSGRVDAPLISWLARPPYMVEDDRFIENISTDSRIRTVLAFIGDGEFVTWDRLQRANVLVSYDYRLSQRFSVGATYRFAFIHSSHPRPLLSFQNSLDLVTSVRF